MGGGWATLARTGYQRGRGNWRGDGGVDQRSDGGACRGIVVKVTAEVTARGRDGVAVLGSGPRAVARRLRPWTHWIRNACAAVAAIPVIAPDTPVSFNQQPCPSRGPPRAGCDHRRRARHRRARGEPGPRREGAASAGFSFGGVIGGNVAAQLGDRCAGSPWSARTWARALADAAAAGRRRQRSGKIRHTAII